MEDNKFIITNEDKGFNSEDVWSCTDLYQLMEWKYHLEELMIRLNLRIRHGPKESKNKTMRYREFQTALLRLIDTRSTIIKIRHKEEILTFWKRSVRNADMDLYKKIDEHCRNIYE